MATVIEAIKSSGGGAFLDATVTADQVFTREDLSSAQQSEGKSTTVIMPAFEVQTFLRVIEEERINSLTSVPAIYWLAMNQPNWREVNTANVQFLSYGGAPIAPDLVGRILESFPNG
jgi:acyl-CoA synthetase (AMP-forming)/AMP-acid ligase II